MKDLRSPFPQAVAGGEASAPFGSDVHGTCEDSIEQAKDLKNHVTSAQQESALIAEDTASTLAQPEQARSERCKDEPAHHICVAPAGEDSKSDALGFVSGAQFHGDNESDLDVSSGLASPERPLVARELGEHQRDASIPCSETPSVLSAASSMDAVESAQTQKEAREAETSSGPRAEVQGATSVQHENDCTNDGVRILGRRYHVEKLVGEGAYGKVMRCSDAKEPGRLVAVKEFKISDSDPDAEDVKRTAHREATLMSQLTHHHVVRCLDSFLVQDRLFIVMEYMPMTLLDLLETSNSGRGLQPAVIRRVVFQLVKVMTYIHSRVCCCPSMATLQR
jgi:hypothetical protein